jgi:predicted nucleotidyltransferase
MQTDAKNNVRLAVLHGSQAKGSANKNSDWDVGILADRKLDLDDRLALADAFAKKFNVPEEKIDIADLRAASPLLQFHVAKEGKLLEGSPSDFLQYKIFAWKHYESTKKFRKFREQFLLSRFAN